MIPIANAADTGTLVTNLTNVVVMPVIALLIVLGLVYFLYGVFKFVANANVEDKKEGRDAMIYGLIGLAVMVSAFGVIRLIVNTTGATTPQSLNNAQNSLSGFTK